MGFSLKHPRLHFWNFAGFRGSEEGRTHTQFWKRAKYAIKSENCFPCAWIYRRGRYWSCRESWRVLPLILQSMITTYTNDIDASFRSTTSRRAITIWLCLSNSFEELYWFFESLLGTESILVILLFWRKRDEDGSRRFVSGGNEAKLHNSVKQWQENLKA